MANKSRELQMYEKMAGKSVKDRKLQMCSAYAFIGLTTGIFAGRGGSLAWLLFGAVFGLSLGILGGFIWLKMIQKPYKKFSRLEKSEGYTDETLAEAYNLLNRHQSRSKRMSCAVIVAMAHNFRGEFSRTLSVLAAMDETVFFTDPTNAHDYYAALLTAYLVSGDLDHASDAYNRGAYYMRTYMNNPSSGSHVSQALAIYELYIGHYDVSLQLLENAARIGRDDYRPENRIPDENMSSMICYWKAVNFASMGDKASAWEMINSCKNFYKTPYYGSLCQKLLDDMAKGEKSKKNPEMITDVETFS